MKTGDQVIKLKPKRLSARQAAWLLVTPQDQLNDYLQKYNAALLATYPNISETSSLASRFIQMIKEQEVAKFSDWLEDAQNCSISTLKNFARKLSEDFDAVYAALQYDWSNGQLEGQVNRLKTIKRLMYGRANFDLLRLRVLCA